MTKKSVGIDLKDTQILCKDSSFKYSSFLTNGNLVTVKLKPIDKLDDIVLNKKTFDNDRIFKYEADIQTKAEVVVIKPATKEELRRIKVDKKRYTQTYEEYMRNMYPIAIKQDLFWMENVLNGASKAQPIVFENEYYVLLPDIKWDGKDPNSIHYLNIVKDRSLLNIRHLTDEHLPMLQNMYDVALPKVAKLCGKDPSELRAYFHMKPSYNLLHCHFTTLRKFSEGIGIDHSVSLFNVIQNIKMMGDYYQKITLEVVE